MTLEDLFGKEAVESASNHGPIFIIVHTDKGTALGCATSYSEACEVQLQRGWRAISHIEGY